ncbi:MULTISPECIES: hypothetical protein [unclassified Nocardiopsis]|uniref:hypothetical protein n=1 Tax=unclassified Nocardiopsis TaxID=2649073 RepID=UPI001358515C|nr:MULTISPECIES: hypothetical protein [unclassified Nocardiopsis]
MVLTLVFVTAVAAAVLFLARPGDVSGPGNTGYEEEWTLLTPEPGGPTAGIPRGGYTESDERAVRPVE